jgi:hypothetical protein
MSVADVSVPGLPAVDWAALRARYEQQATLPALTGRVVLEVVSVDDERLCVRQRLWTDCLTRTDLMNAVALLRDGTIGGTPVQIAEGLRRWYSGGPQVRIGCERTPNLCAVVLKDLGQIG